jgi:hypothetical protein
MEVPSSTVIDTGLGGTGAAAPAIHAQRAKFGRHPAYPHTQLQTPMG